MAEVDGHAIQVEAKERAVLRRVEGIIWEQQLWEEGREREVVVVVVVVVERVELMR